MNAPFPLPMPQGGPAHAIYAPSSAHRWAVEHGCSASAMAIAALYADIGEPDEGEEATEGTAAHEELERCLGPLDGVSYDNLTNILPINSEHPAAYAVALAIDYVRKLPPGRIWIERRVRLTDDIWGRCDICHWEAATNTLTILDLKNGHVGVDAEENEQLRIYAAGSIFTHHLPALWIRYCVVQPHDFRPVPPVKQFVESVADLRKFAERVAAIPSGPLVFKAGEQCTYCPLIGKCEASRDLLQHLGRAMAFSPDDVPPHSVALFLALKKACVDWFKNLESAQLKKALKGTVPAGMGVFTSATHRAWINEAEARDLVVREKGVTALSPPTPAQAEAMGIDKAVVATMAKAPPGGPVLALAGDKRKPWTGGKSAAEMFKGVTG